MKVWLLLWALPALDLAPLMPLEPQFPLDLTEANRQLLIENPQRLEEEKKHIQSMLEQHSFPWLTVITLLGCGGLGWTLYLMRPYWPQYTKPIAPLSPKQQLEQALQTLQQRQALKQENSQQDVIELSSILQTALQFQLGLDAKKRTTTELIQILKNESVLTPSQKEEMITLLTAIDSIKYAGNTPSIEGIKQMHQQIQNIVERL